MSYKTRTQRDSIANSGFTIVELLIVVVVIAILAAITITAYTGVTERARSSAVEAQVASAAKLLSVNRAQSPTQAFPADPSDAGFTAPTDYNMNYYLSPASDSYCLDIQDQSDVNLIWSSRSSNLTTQQLGCPETGLVGWWPLKGDANDATSAGNDGTVTAATLTTGADGTPNGAYSFDGASAWIVAVGTSSDYSSLFADNTSTWSVCAWFNHISSTSDITVVGRSGGTGTGATYAAFIDANDRLQIDIRGDYTNLGTVTAGAWHMFCTSWDGEEGYGYVDGGPAIPLAIGDASVQSYPFAIGTTKSGNTFEFAGSIDDVRVYNRVINEAEVTILYAAGAQ